MSTNHISFLSLSFSTLLPYVGNNDSDTIYSLEGHFAFILHSILLWCSHVFEAREIRSEKFTSFWNKISLIEKEMQHLFVRSVLLVFLGLQCVAKVFIHVEFLYPKSTIITLLPCIFCIKMSLLYFPFNDRTMRFSIRCILKREDLGSMKWSELAKKKMLFCSWCKNTTILIALKFWMTLIW